MDWYLSTHITIIRLRLRGINARGIFINDIIAPVVASSTNSEFMVRASDKNDTENVKKALMIINPDAYYWGLINDEDALKEIFKRSNIRMAGNVCNQMKKEALFRLSLLLS